MKTINKLSDSEKNAEYWLNGKKVLEFVPWSEDWFKNVKIKEL